MTQITWAAVRQTAAERYGSLPRAEDEQVIIDVFEIMPSVVLQAIDQVHDAWKAGKVTWPWAALAGRLTKGASAVRDATVNTGTGKARAAARTEQWIRVTGIHYDRSSEIDDELFGDQGRLRTHVEDDDLRRRLLELWEHERPRGEQVEREAEARALRVTGIRGPRPPAQPKPWPAGEPIPDEPAFTEDGAFA